MKKVYVLLLIAILALMAGCTQSGKTPSMVDAYTTVIDKLYTEDSGLNDNIKYLAIDTSRMVNLPDETKAELLKQLENYGFTVLNMNFEELKKEGYIKDFYFEKGILFQIEDKPMQNNSITMNASKWRSGLGAIGYDNLIIKYKDGKWEITELGSVRIS